MDDLKFYCNTFFWIMIVGTVIFGNIASCVQGVK
jgi:hypothetical protein